MARAIEDFYSIEDAVGYGEFSVVHEGYHKETKKACAIKIIDKNSLSERQRQRVDMEVDILKTCDHPNIVKLIDAFENPQRYYIVMELIKGGDLFEKLLQVSRYSEEHAKIAIYRILKAVQYLHSKGIAHRDLKPENMLVDQDDCTIVKISDFGLAKRVSDDDPLSTPCGTISYAAPEVSSEGAYRMEVDMWSVGVICFTLLSGGPPFCAEDEDELLEVIANAQFSFSSPIWNEISSEAKDLIRKLLERDVNMRLTATKALRHPWFASLSSLSNSDDGNSSASSSVLPEPKQNVLLADLEHVNISPQSSKEKLRQLNAAIDSQRDGIVSLKPASESSIAKRRQQKRQNQD